MKKLRNYLSFALVLVAVVLAGCGGTDYGVDKSWLVAQIRTQTNRSLIGTGARVSDVTCAGESPDYACLVLLNDGSQLNLTAKCDDTDCVWRRVG